MKKGIDAVISTIILLIIAVAIVGLAYAFISGYFNAVTGSAVIISGASSCDSTGAVYLSIRNAGTQAIDPSGISITRTRCTPGPCGPFNGIASLTASGLDANGFIAVGTTAIGTEIPSDACGSGNSCVYELNVGGSVYTTRANCA